MKKALYIILVVAIMAAVVSGCGSKADENKPIAAVKQEAAGMNIDQLKAVINDYKKSIEAKKPEIQKLQEQLKKIPITQMMGKEASGIKNDIAAVTTSIRALTERMNAYISELKAKGGSM